MKKMRRRALSVILCLCMALSLCPTTVQVHAADKLNNVFLNSKGSDTATGAAPSAAVATFAKAKELLAAGGTIWICGAVNVTDTQTWDLAGYGANGSGAGSVKRWISGGVSGITDGTYSGNLVNITDSGSLTVTNCDINGEKSIGQTSSLFYVAGSLASVTLSDGAVAEDAYANQGGAFYITNGASGTVNGTAVVRNCQTKDAGAIADVGSGSHFTVGGTASVTGNSGAYAPIFLRGSGNTLTIQDSAVLSGNTGSVAGLVQTHGSNTVAITGGTITGNTGANCGAFLLIAGDKLTMSGGTISKNEATSGSGGAIQLNKTAAATITGGSVTDNTASGNGAGIYAADTTATVNVGGTASITKNTDAGTKGNIYLPANTTLHVTSALSGGAAIGVYAQGTAYGVDKDFAAGSGYTIQSGDAKYFSDDRAVFSPMFDSANNALKWAGAVENVFLRSSGSDSADGTTPDTAVSTFAQAKKLLKPGGVIWICGEVDANGAESWDLDGYGANATGAGTIRRWVKGDVAGIANGTYAANLVVANGAANSVTMTNLTLDGLNAGLSAGGSNANSGSNIWAKNGGTVTLGTGATVENGVSYHGAGVSLTDGSALIMTGDSVIKGCVAGDAGGAVDMSGKSSLSMSGTAKITGCSSPFSVIFLRNANGTGNTVSLSGSAAITGNTTTRSDQGTIDGHGGNTIILAEQAAISDNTAGKGGGIELEKNDTLTMTGGSITGNTASILGAGVNVNVSSAIVNLSGTASITGNKDTSVKGNLAVPTGYKVHVTGALTGAVSSIGVRVAAADHKNLHEFAQGTAVYTTTATDASVFMDDYTTLPVELTPGSGDGTDNTIRFAGYQVAYDTNGNVTSTEDVPVPDTIAAKTGLSYESANLLPTATLTRNGYIFDGWYTAADDSGMQVTSATQYSDIQTDRTVTTVTLYAHWTEKAQYSVVYDTNGGSSAAGITNLKWTARGLISAEANSSTRPGYTLTDWKYDPSGMNVNVTDTVAYRTLARLDTVTTITLLAQWTENAAVDINYLSADRTMGRVTEAAESVKPATGTPAGSAAVAETGYTFDGWYDADGNLLSTDSNFVPTRNADGIYEAATYTARFSANTDTSYKVKYYQQDITGTGYTEVTADAVDAQGTTAAEPAVTENAYDGFVYERTTYQTSTAAEGAAAQTIAADGSLVVSLYYTRNMHNVTFDVQGHGVAPTGYTNVRLGATITEPTELTETGYTFGGWYTDAACTTAWDFATSAMPDTDLTLYAKWTVNSYTVRFAAETGGALGGTTTDQAVDYGGQAAAVCTQTPDNTDYDFLGWSYDYTGADGQTYSGVTADYSKVPVYGDVTFTATYAKKPYISIVATNGQDNIVQGATPDTAAAYAVKSAIDSSLTPLTLPTEMAMCYKPVNDNYKLAGITVTDLAGNTATLHDGTNTFTPAGAVAPVIITVSYDDQTIIATNINDSLQFSVLFSPIQTSYQVKHFEQNVDGSYPAEATDSDSYSDVDAGTVASYTSKTYTGASYDANKTTWEATDLAASSTVLAVQPDGSLVIRLYYPRDTYTVFYDSNGHGSAPAAQYHVRYGATLEQPGAMTENGWTFDGWYTDSACTDGNQWTFGTGGTTVAGNTTLYAKWSAKTYTVTYDTQGGTAVADQTGVVWSQSLLTAGTTRPGYIFASWNRKADGTGDTVTDQTTYAAIAGNDDTQMKETIYAIWTERADFLLHYDSAGGTDVTDLAGISWTQKGLASPVSVRTGYTFAGWYTAAGDRIDDTTPFSAIDPTGASDATVTAKWETNHYNIAFDRNGADATGTMSNEEMTYDSSASLTANAYLRAGYDFTGWNTAADGTGTSYADAAEVENLSAESGGTVTLYAQWNPHTYRISFNFNGGYGTMEEMQMTYDVSKTLTANAFARSGYTFTGWNTAADGSGTGYADQAAVQNLTAEDNGDVILYAQWQEKEATIRYMSADTAMGTVSIASEEIGEDTGAAAGSVAIAKNGYHFVSWTNEQGTVVSTEAEFQPAKTDGLFQSATYTANFAANLYTVSFDANGGNGSMDDEYMTYDAAKQELTLNTFTRSGYTFTGWNTAADGSGTGYADQAAVQNLTAENHGNVILYAQWQEKEATIRYVSADTAMGTVSIASEEIGEVTGAAAGSVAIAKKGYHFVSWTNEQGTVVSTEAEFQPAKADGLFQSVTYTANFAANPYTVSFDANGGSGSMSGEGMTYDGAGQKLDTNTFTRDGYTFAGWNTAADGSGTAYTDAESVQNLIAADNGIIRLYAQWTKNADTNPGTGTGGTANTGSNQSTAAGDAADSEITDSDAADGETVQGTDTGDKTNTGLWLALCLTALAGAGLSLLTFTGFRKKKEENDQ